MTDDAELMNAAISIQRIYSANHWHEILSTLPTRHFLQSWEWGEVKAQTGWHAERYIVCLPGHDKPFTAFQFLWRQPLRYLPLRVAYVPKGPLLDWSNESAVTLALDAVEIVTNARRTIFVKMDPDVRSDGEIGQTLQAMLSQRGWCFSREQIQFQNTAISMLPSHPDPAPDDECVAQSLLLPLKSKWRYNIRLAQRRGITIRQGGPADFRSFYDLYAETSTRDQFLIRPFSYYKTLWQTFLDAQEQPENPAGGALFLAEHEEEDSPVAGVFLTRYAEQAVYFNGASSQHRRRDMPNHLLQYEALRWSLEQGCTHYDWWGAPTDLDDPEDDMQGVWNFKRGFGPEFAPHIGAWDWPQSKKAYRLYVDGMPRVLNLMRRFG